MQKKGSFLNSHFFGKKIIFNICSKQLSDMKNDRYQGMQRLEDYVFEEAMHFWKSLDVFDLNRRI